MIRSLTAGHPQTRRVERLSDRLLNWASILDDVTRRQAENTASLPFIHPHVALMPDAHLGKGATVGPVLDPRGDHPGGGRRRHGCGMIAVRTPWSRRRGARPRALAPLRGDIERAVPSRPGSTTAGSPTPPGGGSGAGRVRRRARDRVLRGVSADPELDAAVGQPRLGQPLHRGDRRRAGAAVAACTREPRAGTDRHEAHLDRPATGRAGAPGPARPDLAWLDEGKPEFDRYIAELRWAQHFALLNREE